jgi:hypothetical protein
MDQATEEELLRVRSSGFIDSNPNVIVVDNFYKDPDSIRNFVINQLPFKESNYHKGKRSTPFILDGTKERLEQILGKKIINWYHPTYANGTFQYCTPNDPIVYHIDSQMFAGVVYLTPNAPLRYGTQTFRSKITGRTRFGRDDESQAQFDLSFKTDGKNYNFFDDSKLEVVDNIGNVYNRLLLWDARTIHAAERYFGSNITNSRLFHLFFFDIE